MSILLKRKNNLYLMSLSLLLVYLTTIQQSRTFLSTVVNISINNDHITSHRYSNPLLKKINIKYLRRTQRIFIEVVRKYTKRRRVQSGPFHDRVNTDTDLLLLSVRTPLRNERKDHPSDSL